MTTANEIITSALEEIERPAADETVAAEDAALGLKALNRMLHGWEIEYGVDLGHSDLVLTDTVTLPDSHIRAVELNLALALGPKFTAPIRPDTAILAERGMRALQAAYADVPELEFDRGLQNRLGGLNGTERFDG